MQEKKNKKTITHLFVDIGGVLLTNGWDHQARERAAMHFNLPFAEIENRHHLTFEVFERGFFTLEEYLNLVIFYQKRPFTQAQFRQFMYDQSQPYSDMIALITELKKCYGLKVVVVSNEARELNAYRIQTFQLNHFVDVFISSSFVHLRKPDLEIFRFALDVSLAAPEQVLYIENTSLFVQMAEKLGISSILHTDTTSTREKLAAFGLKS
jgi:putative hydrolase of the HAD superfamily